MIKFVASLILFWSAALAAKDPNTLEQMDSVLDRLENKLMEEEASTLRISTPSFLPKSRTAKQRLEIPASILAAPLPQQKSFEALTADIRRIEQDADDLSGHIEKLKAEFQAVAEKGNFIEFMAKFEDPDTSVLRELSLSIDRHEVYQTTDREGQWLPGPELLLYSGPLEPGAHELQLKARIMRRSPVNLPLDQNLYHLYEQTFTVTIPKGDFHQGYRLKFAQPEKQNIHAQAVLENYQIP